MKHTRKQTKRTTTTPNIDRARLARHHGAAIPLRPLTAVPPMKPPPDVLTLEDVTGTCETGDLLENLLDEVRTLLLAANELVRPTDDAMGNLLPFALRKVEAAMKAYEQQNVEPATAAAAAE